MAKTDIDAATGSHEVARGDRQGAQRSPAVSNEQLSRERTTRILLIAMIIFYGAYIAHEWWVGKPFDTIGHFLENGIVMFLGWCLGKNYANRSSR